jgi:16S rRNA (uracil1498-N3)-methyltransferase
MARPSGGEASRPVAHVFVEDLSSPALAADDERHLASVLRLRDGEHVTACDGAGSVIPCVVGIAGRGRVHLEPQGEPVQQARPSPAITIAFALVKGDRPEWAVQKLVEIGVDRIVPLVTARTVVRPTGAAATARSVRLRRVAREAAMQCRRAYLAHVDEVTTLDALLAGSGSDLAVAEAHGRPPSLDTPTLVVGPEGGFADGEVEAGVARVRLGPHVLRTETAAVVSGTLLASLRDGLVLAPPR